MRPEIEWSRVRRVLIVRLRSIGDTVLSTPSLIALKRFIPDAEIDILLEEWVSPVLSGFQAVDQVHTIGAVSKLSVGWEIRRRRYDVVFNLHGGTTATFFTFASGAPYRVGYRDYQYAFLHNYLLSSSADFWGRDKTHSAEHQLALLGFAGVPVKDLPRSSLAVTDSALESLEQKHLERTGRPMPGRFALLHPAAAFDTKEWPVQNFARVAEFLTANGIGVVAVAAQNETHVLDALRSAASISVDTFDNLALPEITALASRARVFIGNDSGIAHIAAAVQTPSVVIFGSSNRNHWRPWTDAPNEIVFQEFACQPCSGRGCKEFGEPRCIQTISVESVVESIARVLAK